MFKKRSQGEIHVQKPVPAKGAQPRGSMPGGKPWAGEPGSWVGVLLEQRCHLTGLQKVTIQCAQIPRNPAQLNCGVKFTVQPGRHT